jgi:hypothetical protein
MPLFFEFATLIETQSPGRVRRSTTIAESGDVCLTNRPSLAPDRVEASLDQLAPRRAGCVGPMHHA